jgi:hypothetical protein
MRSLSHRSVIAAVLLVAAGALWSAPGAAQSTDHPKDAPPAATDEQPEAKRPFPALFPRGQEACFGRTYDAAHLKVNPKQRVASFFLFKKLRPDPLSEWDDASADEMRAQDLDPKQSLGLDVILRLRDRPGLFLQSFECHGDDKTGHCSIDCDGGSFNMKPAGGAMMVENEGFEVEGGCDGGLDFVDPGRADRSFRLDAATPAACWKELESSRPSLAVGGPPLRERFGAGNPPCYERAYDRDHLAKQPTQSVATIWFRKDGEAFRIGAQLRNGHRAEAKLNCDPNTYGWSCFRDGAEIEVEPAGADGSRSYPSPTVILARAGADKMTIRNHRNHLAKALGLQLGKGDDVFQLSASPGGRCTSP